MLAQGHPQPQHRKGAWHQLSSKEESVGRSSVRTARGTQARAWGELGAGRGNWGALLFSSGQTFLVKVALRAHLGGAPRVRCAGRPFAAPLARDERGPRTLRKYGHQGPHGARPPPEGVPRACSPGNPAAEGGGITGSPCRQGNGHREVEQLIQGHTARRRWSPGFDVRPRGS